MSKLFKLKEWLSVEAAAKSLAIAFGEDVTEADVLRLALDGKLLLSIHFVNPVSAQAKKVVLRKDLKYRPTVIHLLQTGMSDYWDDEHALISDGGLEKLTGVFDLAMRGTEVLVVEDKYQQLVRGPAVDLDLLGGALVRDAAGNYWCLQDTFGTMVLTDSAGTRREIKNAHSPSVRLPDDGVLVVRTKALQSLISPSIRSEIDKPLSTRERNNLLSVIAILCDDAKTDYKKPSAAATALKSTAEKLNISVGETTIRDILKQVANVVEHKLKLKKS